MEAIESEIIDPHSEVTTETLEHLPKDIRHPGGLVEEIMDYMNTTSMCYQPAFSLSAALVTAGLLYGRRYADESGMRTNIFAINIGHTSAGKDHGISIIKKILHAGEADDLWIGEVTSDSAVEHALDLNPRRLLLIDEAGHFFSACNDLGGGSALRSVKPFLLRAWSSASGCLKGKQRAPQNGKPSIPVEIFCPHVMLLGTTQPQIFFSGTRTADLQDGWLARTLFFISPSRPVPDLTVQPLPVPDTIVAEVRRFKDDEPHAQPIRVPTTPDALDLLNDFNYKVSREMRKADYGNNEIAYLYGKAVENARRIALIIAISRCGSTSRPTIAFTDMKFGVDLVSYTIRYSIAAIEENLSENDEERNKKRLLKIIRESGASGISRQDLTRKSQFLNKSRRDEYLEDLWDARVITFHDTPTGGRIFKAVS